MYQFSAIAAPVVVGLLLVSVPPVLASDEDDREAEKPKAAWIGRVELKRQFSNRGTEDEKTLTQLRLESFPGGPFSFVRIDIPLPDERQTLEGDPSRPRLGDIKLRLNSVRFRAFHTAMNAFLELGFPTADPSDLGTGKVQLTAGLRHTGRLFKGSVPPSISLTGSVQVSQNVSLTGDPSRKEINTTKTELGLQCSWKNPYLKLTFKPNIDWVKDGETGAVLELRGQANLSRPLAVWLMIGTRLWGPGVAGTYEKRIELGAMHFF